MSHVPDNQLSTAPARVPGATDCRHCSAPLELSVVDLGMSPLCQTVCPTRSSSRCEVFYPLHVRACRRCWLLQIPEFVAPDELFTEYAYFSAYSDSWVEHARRYVEDDRRTSASSTRTASSSSSPRTTAICSSTSCRWAFRCSVSIPAANVAAAADGTRSPDADRVLRRRASPSGLSPKGGGPISYWRQNVLAQVPDLNDFVAGVKLLLAPGGTVDLRVPASRRAHRASRVRHDLPRALLLLLAARRSQAIFARTASARSTSSSSPSHGGSLRTFFATPRRLRTPPRPSRTTLGREERTVCAIRRRTRNSRNGSRSPSGRSSSFLFARACEGKHVVGYGAPGKGNTLLNYCGIRTDLLEYTVDRNPYKQGKHLPGTHIPIHPPSASPRRDPTRS